MLFRPGLEKQRQEWHHWRGEIGTQVTSLAENFDRRMDRQDDAIAAVLAEARSTNGRVTALEQQNRVELAVKAEEATQIQVRATTTHFRVMAGITLVSGAFGTVVGIAVTHIH